MILLITEQGSKVNIDGGKIIIQSETIIREVPKELVENISIFGNVQLTTAFVRHCLMRNIPISYFSLRGEYFGRTVSSSGDNISRLKQQLKITENRQFLKEFANIIIEAKTNNQITLLRRHNKVKAKLKREIDEIAKLRTKIGKSETVEEILGYEGIISRNYYKGISKILPPEFEFEKRTRRPPRDPFNSMISLGYTILFHEIIGHIESVGLSAYGGLMHGHRRNHPSLASDIIEEFRSPIVDSTVIDMMINEKVKKEDFETTKEGVFLKQKILKMYLNEIQKKLATRQKYLEYLKEPTTYRKAIYHQCRNLVTAIEENDPYLYKPLRVR